MEALQNQIHPLYLNSLDKSVVGPLPEDYEPIPFDHDAFDFFSLGGVDLTKKSFRVNFYRSLSILSAFLGAGSLMMALIKKNATHKTTLVFLSLLAAMLISLAFSFDKMSKHRLRAMKSKIQKVIDEFNIAHPSTKLSLRSTPNGYEIVQLTGLGMSRSNSESHDEDDLA